MTDIFHAYQLVNGRPKYFTTVDWFSGSSPKPHFFLRNVNKKACVHTNRVIYKSYQNATNTRNTNHAHHSFRPHLDRLYSAPSVGSLRR